MVILRRTSKLRGSLPEAPNGSCESDTALGDWYVNRIVVQRQPLLLLVNSRSLLPIVIRARDVRGLPERLPELVRSRLARIRIPESLIAAEVQAMHPVRVGRAIDRSVLGMLVDFAKSIPFLVRDADTSEDGLRAIEERLEGTPCFVSREGSGTVFPLDVTPNLLRERWRNTG